MIGKEPWMHLANACQMKVPVPLPGSLDKAEKKSYHLQVRQPECSERLFPIAQLPPATLHPFCSKKLEGKVIVVPEED